MAVWGVVLPRARGLPTTWGDRPAGRVQVEHAAAASRVRPPLTRLAVAGPARSKALSLHPPPPGRAARRRPRACAPVPDGRRRALRRRVPGPGRAARGTVGQGWPLGGPVWGPPQSRARLARLRGSFGCLLGSPAPTSFDVIGRLEVGCAREPLQPPPRKGECGRGWGTAPPWGRTAGSRRLRGS